MYNFMYPADLPIDDDAPSAAEAERDAPTAAEIAAAIESQGPAPVSAEDFLTWPEIHSLCEDFDAWTNADHPF